jgi:hypothetical protein
MPKTETERSWQTNPATMQERAVTATIAVPMAREQKVENKVDNKDNDESVHDASSF